MNYKFESQMAKPVQKLMQKHMQLDIISREFTAGYGVADLVGASLSKKNWIVRKEKGQTNPLDQRNIIEVLSIVKPNVPMSLNHLSTHISFSKSTLLKKVLPQMKTLGLIKIENDSYIHLLFNPPMLTSNIVAIELKQTKWKEAILQARRYTFFANQSYIAVWDHTTQFVDNTLLKKHRIGMIGVDQYSAKIILEAPKQKPRNTKMNRYCAEFLYRQSMCIEKD